MTPPPAVAPELLAPRAGEDDRGLVAGVRAGDERAFERLYELHHGPVAAYVRSRVGDAGRAEDVTQEIFLNVVRRLRATDTEIELRPWLLQIARNACIDQHRRGQRVRELSLSDDGALPPADRRRLVARPDTGPELAAERRAAVQDLWGAFDGLSDPHHEILLLRELEGLGYDEIATRMDLTPAGVESMLFRARRRLREEYVQLASGERCREVGALCDQAAAGRLGLRARRLLSRHAAQCRPCRRHALLCGVDPALLRPRTARERLAGLLGLGWLARPASQLVPVGLDPSWLKATGAAVALLVAGLTTGQADHPAPAPAPAGVSAGAPAAVATGNTASGTATRAAPAAGGRPAAASGGATRTSSAGTTTVGAAVAGGGGRRALAATAGGAPARGATPGPGAPTQAGTAGGPTGVGAGAPAAGALRTATGTVGGATSTATRTTSKAAAPVISAAGRAVQNTGAAAQGPAQTAGSAVQGARAGTGGAVQGATQAAGSAVPPVSPPAGEAGAGAAAGGAVSGAGGAVGGAVGGVGGIVGGGGSAGQVVDPLLGGG